MVSLTARKYKPVSGRCLTGSRASNSRVVLDALAIFGIERAIFATNFPVAGLRIGYGALVAAMSRMVSHLPPADRDRLFWKNANAFYRL